MTKPAYLTIGDLLKSEADPNSREAIDVSEEVSIGQLVKHPVRKKYLVALSDAENGKVLVQPHQCVVFLDNVAEADITKVGLTVDKLIQEGDGFGIKYIGTPYKPETASDSASG